MIKIFFPILHPSLAGDVKEDILFLSPIRSQAGEETHRFYIPPELPLDEKQSQKYIRHLLQYGEMFKTPGEISQTFLLQLYGSDPESPSLLKASIKKGRDNRKVPSTSPFFIGQLTLLLQWVLEENFIELESLNREIQQQMEMLRRSLGEEREEDTFLPPSQDIKGELFYFLSWKRLLPWFFLFTKKHQVLVVKHQEIVDEWREYGIKIMEKKGKHIIQERGWRLILKSSPIEGMRWLDEEREIIVEAEGENPK